VGACGLCGKRADLWDRQTALERGLLRRYASLRDFTTELARRVDAPDTRPTGTKEVASHLGRSPQWVREHAPLLGGEKQNPGRRGERWLFPPLAEVAERARSNGDAT
jgi:hypothetical protein